MATCNHFHNILRPFDVLPNFLFTTSETWYISTYKHDMYDLSHELQNNLRLKVLNPTAFSPLGGQNAHTRKKKRLKVLKLQRIIAQCPVLPPKQKFCQYYQKALERQKLIPPSKMPPRMKTRASLIYPVNDFPRKPPPASNSAQISSNLISLLILATLRPFLQL